MYEVQEFKEAFNMIDHNRFNSVQYIQYAAGSLFRILISYREHEFRSPDSTNHQGKLFEIKGIWKRCLGGAHRVHFEHSLLHDSVTTIRVAPG